MELAAKLVKGDTLNKTTLTEIVTVKSRRRGDRRQVPIQGRLRLRLKGAHCPAGRLRPFRDRPIWQLDLHCEVSERVPLSGSRISVRSPAARRALLNPTIKDVARLARVSTATVSNVINGTSFVSAPLKARVLEAVAQLGFAPSRVARGLRMQSTRLIGVVVADITNPFFSELVRRIGSIADLLKYNVLLCEADHDAAKELAALHLLAAHRVEGVILAPTGPAAMYFEPPIRISPAPL